MELDKSYYIYKLLKLKGIGRVLVNKILERLSTTDNNITCTSLKDSIIDELKSFLNDDQITEFRTLDYQLQEQLNEFKARDVSIVSILDSSYPRLLSLSLDKSSPPILSCMGNLDLLEMPTVGFCGSRRASERGLYVARDCVEQLTHQEVAIVSGYAAGIDQQVHFTALESGGFTIIVLPEGILNFKIRRIFHNNWDWDRVLVISEFLPGDIWMSSRAMQRNSTIVALSNVMVLIEAAKKGGSVDAGKKALKLKRTLYVTRYEDMVETAGGNKELLDLQATPLLRDKKTGRANLSHLIENINNFKHKGNLTTEQLTFL
jgi:DNA processing protein